MDQPHRIEFLRTAAREFEKLSPEVRPRIRTAVDGLALEPRPSGAKLLVGTGKLRVWRLRVGDHRVLYQIEDQRITVLVVRIADRREIYSQTALRRLLDRLRSDSRGTDR